MSPIWANILAWIGHTTPKIQLLCKMVGLAFTLPGSSRERSLLTISEPQPELMTEELTLCQASHRASDQL